MKIVLTGATGLIGSRFEELMFESHDITPLSSSKGIDLTDKDSISNFLSNKDFDAVIHLAGKTDVDGCEQDKEEDVNILGVSGQDLASLNIKDVDAQKFKSKKTAFSVNAIGTRNLYEYAKERKTRFIYISTDFVFKGEGEYNEKSPADPINWYGMTKWYGENVINVNEDLIVRISFPYGYPSPVKKDFLQRMIDLLRERSEVSLIEDQTITPTFIDDVVLGLDFLLSKEVVGIYHLAGSSSVSPIYIGDMLKEAFGLGTAISSTTRDKIYAGKAARPFQSIMLNDKIRELGFTPKGFTEGFNLVKSRS